MFTHPDFCVLPFEKVPLNRDIYLMDVCWMKQYEAARLKLFAGQGDTQVGMISYAAARSVDSESLELSWYPNIHDRFHEVAVRLPRTAFVTCVTLPQWDERPHIFVDSRWLENLHTRPFSAFALIDAIGMKSAILSGRLNSASLVRVRERIDALAEAHPHVAFVSFADSLLLKTNWTAGLYESDCRYTYEPESLVRLFPGLARVYAEELGFGIYAAITQGANEYEDTALLHHSVTRNHVSLNSLGLPFAQLMAIDDAVRFALRARHHPPSELYLDEHFYHSLRFRYGFEKHREPHSSYRSPLASRPRDYFYLSAQRVLENLDASKIYSGSQEDQNPLA